MRFPGSFILNGLQPLKMAVYPYTAHRLSKNCVFQQPAKRHEYNPSLCNEQTVSFMTCNTFAHQGCQLLPGLPGITQLFCVQGQLVKC